MTPELRKEKQDRFAAAVAKLKELKAAEPNAEQVAHERAAAMHLTTTFGISRPLSDRYVAQAVKAPGGTGELSDEILGRITNLDDKFGAAFMVLPHHVDQILKGGKHMSRRFRKWGDEGDVFHVRGKAFRFFRVARMRVGDITDDDIRKEGYATREEFEQMWVKAHPKAVAAGKTLQADELCWSHEYEPV
jgi:N4-acetylcytidine amidohydrolase